MEMSSFTGVHRYILLSYQKHVQISVNLKIKAIFYSINYFTRAFNIAAFTNGGPEVDSQL